MTEHAGRCVALESCGNGVWRAPGACIVDRTGRKRLPIGHSSFEGVAADSVYVDKTQLIADLLDSNYAVTLFCRPRRFGKSLNLTMMRTFFELPPDGRSRAALFEGTDVWQADGGNWREHQGVYPVISLSMIAAKGLTWEATFDSLKQMIAVEYNRHDYLASSERLNDGERRYFRRIASGQADTGDYSDSLRRLALMLNEHHRHKVVVLIDEYDAPVMASYSAPNGGYYEEAVAFLKTWLTGTLKDNDNVLALACLTGVQRISKESIFSDLNNLVVNTALSDRFDERYGFTEAEVSALLSYLGFGRECLDTARQWYDGYRFGTQDVYNPWSVLNYLDNDCAADSYWGNTSGNSLIGDMLRRADADTLQQIYDLMQPGGVVTAPLDLSVVFPDLGIRKDAVWSMLYLAGYLTTEDTGFPGQTRLLRRLRIPDLEIAGLYRDEIIGRFASSTDSMEGERRLARFHEALAKGDAETLNAELGAILRDSTSSFDVVSENSCHMLLMGLCFGVSGYGDPLSNKEAGYGRYDLRLEPALPGTFGAMFAAPGPRPVITIEMKYVRPADGVDGKTLDDELRAKAGEALRQITERWYDERLPDNAQGRLRWGIAVGGRHCVAIAERV